MKNATFNNLISLQYPDDFVELSDSENEKYFTGNLLRKSFQNKEKHILLSLSKSKSFFLNRFVKIETVVGNSLSSLESSLKEFQYIEEIKSNVFNCTSISECFAYTASDQGVRQYGELTIFKVKSAFYIIYCICRFDDKDEHKETFEQFKKSFTHIETE